MKATGVFIPLLGLVGVLSVAASGATVSAGSDAGIEALIKTTLSQRFPGHPIESVRVGPLPGLYEVVTPDEVIYTDAQADKIFVGQMIDTKTREDLSSKEWNELHSIDFNALPFTDAIKTVRGDGSRVVAVFADPNCPYCQQLEQNIKSLTNLTIYTFLYPLESVHPGATARAHAIWCAKDRSLAWSSWMTSRVQPPEAAAPCAADPVDSLHQLGTRLDISVTPTLFFADGHRFSGVLTAGDFLKQFPAKPNR